MKSVIFDLDGTLWDASIPITEAWREVGRKYFGPDYQLSVEQVSSLMGKTMDEIAATLIPEGSAGLVIAPFVEECFRYENEYLADHPGAFYEREIEVLKELSAHYALYIVSNAQAGYIDNFVKVLPEPLILDHMCWSDTKKEKTVTIRALMDRHGIDPADAIYVGDTKKDREAALGAGIGFVYCRYGFEKAPQGDDVVAGSFPELSQAIEKAFR